VQIFTLLLDKGGFVLFHSDCSFYLRCKRVAVDWRKNDHNSAVWEKLSLKPDYHVSVRHHRDFGADVTSLVVRTIVFKQLKDFQILHHFLRELASSEIILELVECFHGNFRKDDLTSDHVFIFKPFHRSLMHGKGEWRLFRWLQLKRFFPFVCFTFNIFCDQVPKNFHGVLFHVCVFGCLWGLCLLIFNGGLVEQNVLFELVKVDEAEKCFESLRVHFLVKLHIVFEGQVKVIDLFLAELGA